MFADIKNNKNLFNLIKENKGIVDSLLSTHEIKEVDYSQETLFSILKAFLDLNAENYIKYKLEGEVEETNVIEEGEILQVLQDTRVLTLYNNQKQEIFVVKAGKKLVFIAKSLKSLQI